MPSPATPRTGQFEGGCVFIDGAHALLLPINAFLLGRLIRVGVARDRAAASARMGMCAAPRAAYSPLAES